MKRKRITKLNKILKFYKTELVPIQSQVQAQHSKTEQLQGAIQKSIENMASSMKSWAESQATISNRMAGVASISQSQTKLKSLKDELVAAEAELLRTRDVLREKMARIETMDKLIARKIAAAEYEERQKEQLSDDERYLNSKFGEM